MRVFRASDKMSAEEPMSPAGAQGWDPISSILPIIRCWAPVVSGARNSPATLKY